MSTKTSGVALITSLLLLSVITLLVMAMTTRQQLDLQRSTHLAHAEQAHWYSLSAENWARRVLNSDSQGVDSLHDNWAVSVPPLAIEQGLVAGSIEDLQGRFNLNNLLQAGEPHRLSIARFERMLEQLKIDTVIIPALIDWLDEDTIETTDGAEDSYYATRQPPYRAANQLMADTSELRLVRRVDEAIYAKLRPYITALPVATGINVNTASALVLSALAEDDALDVAAIMTDRERSAFNNIEQLKPYFPGPKPSSAKPRSGPDSTAKSDMDGLVVASSYFMMTTDVSLGVSRQRRQALLFRNKQSTASLRQSPLSNL